ncbi:hypothetical protein E2C01_026003 [Portunus trituberculatus]|uniref:Uncharacterized protein n=1 Tax=Portunus trituberculatus TaxID=210409 RepID=A0A5B7EGZ0_PORTR|nr:hypothetical protein [Portunus trituberculatus]
MAVCLAVCCSTNKTHQVLEPLESKQAVAMDTTAKQRPVLATAAREVLCQWWWWW